MSSSPPPPVRALTFIAHWVQHFHFPAILCWSICIEIFVHRRLTKNSTTHNTPSRTIFQGFFQDNAERVERIHTPSEASLGNILTLSKNKTKQNSFSSCVPCRPFFSEKKNGSKFISRATFSCVVYYVHGIINLQKTCRWVNKKKRQNSPPRGEI